MSLADYLVGLARLALLLIPAVGFGRFVRVTLMTLPSHSLEWLVDIVVTISVLVVGSEALGIVALDRYWVLTSLLWIVGAVVVAVQRSSSTRRPSQPEFAFGASPEATGSTHRPVEPAPPTPPAPAAQRLRCGVAAAALAVVWGQWGLLTSDAYGGGILSFDSLWYHLPFAASFAQTGSVTRVLFTQADPFVAYYPANAELFHSIGLIAMGSDLLSPMVNLAWLAVALLAAWCCGRPWRIEPITLTAGCLIVGVPILGAGQPGSAFNDIFGLAMMMAAIALAVATDRHRGMYVACGLALGLAIGTKVTFAVPAVTIGCGTALVMPAGRRIKTLGLLGIPALLTGGWWYLRATLDTGDPLGLRVHIGPIVLPGPDSPLANAASQTVISALAKPHLFGSRLAPGLNYAFGPLWPLLLAGSTAGLVVAVVLRHRPTKSGVIAMAGICAALAYLVFPTGASQIEQQSVRRQPALRNAGDRHRAARRCAACRRLQTASAHGVGAADGGGADRHAVRGSALAATDRASRRLCRRGSCHHRRSSKATTLAVIPDGALDWPDRGRDSVRGGGVRSRTPLFCAALSLSRRLRHSHWSALPMGTRDFALAAGSVRDS